jgi:hypothetical protein
MKTGAAERFASNQSEDGIVDLVSVMGRKTLGGNEIPGYGLRELNSRRQGRWPMV